MINKDKILANNLFADCPTYKLHELWNGYKKAEYEDGWFEEDNPVTPYKEQYVNRIGPLGVTLCEVDLLRAIAYRYFEEE